ncbi:hypothetical protein CTAYLR_007837 [Chrysophaeum taylorii]|uniref:FAD dependent oxidoreductase domain-containing protein n=1 Tax=Chrysophaeum taylorii TaxID=2483200 RepID=A0AAD7UA53_9STRA|nr:hypothetical protein CTAYLR_007837 [Chrysophaeum taylorii]
MDEEVVDWEVVESVTRVRYAVIGAGLTGTAAAKHLASRFGSEVCLIGPSEGQHGALGACYDEGRIYRGLDPIEVWATLAQKSIKRYPAIASASGIDFYRECGILVFGVPDEYVRETERVAASMGTDLERFDGAAAIKSRFPMIGVPASSRVVGLYQATGAGHLSPRELVEAQTALGAAAGLARISEEVRRVVKTSTSFSIELEHGRVEATDGVLVCAGAFTSLGGLVPDPPLDIHLAGAQALLCELSPKSTAALADMPCLIYEGETADRCFYLLPPIRYPDGRMFLKIGPSTAFAPTLRSRSEVEAWFKRDSCTPDFIAAARVAIKDLLPGAEVVAARPLLCVTDASPNSHPYVDLLDDAQTWGVCTAGNGWAAKSSEELGSVAARMMANRETHWCRDPDLPKADFVALRKEVKVEPSRRPLCALL